MPDSLEEPRGTLSRALEKADTGGLLPATPYSLSAMGKVPTANVTHMVCTTRCSGMVRLQQAHSQRRGPRAGHDRTRCTPSLEASSAAPESGAASGDPSRELLAAAAGCRGATAPAGCASALGLSVSLSAPLSFFAMSSFSTLI